MWNKQRPQQLFVSIEKKTSHDCKWRRFKFAWCRQKVGDDANINMGEQRANIALESMRNNPLHTITATPARLWMVTTLVNLIQQWNNYYLIRSCKWSMDLPLIFWGHYVGLLNVTLSDSTNGPALQSNFGCTNANGTKYWRLKKPTIDVFSQFPHFNCANISRDVE